MASQPLQSFPCLGALDAAVPLIARNDSDADASRRRSSLGWAFARESSIAAVIVRKTCQVALDYNTITAERHTFNLAFRAFACPGSPRCVLGGVKKVSIHTSER